MKPGKARDIFRAVELDDEEAVKYYVEEKKVNLTDSDYEHSQTAAHIASKDGNLKILKYLLEKEPELVNVEDFYGSKVFFLAIENNHLHIIKYLAEKQLVDIREKNNRCFDNTGLHRAAEYGFLDIVKYFISQNVDVNVLNKFNQPPVFLAAESKHYHVIKYLVEEQNANLTLVDTLGHNILYKAATNDDVDLLKYVLDERKVPLDINWKDQFEDTLVNRAAYLNKYQALVYLVDEKHGDIDTVDIWKQTPLHCAARESNYEVCKFLIEHGANTDLQNDIGFTPLDEAKDQKIIQMIKDASANLTVSHKREERSVIKSLRPIGFPLQGEMNTNSYQTIGPTNNTFDPFKDMDSFRLQAFLAIAGILFKGNKRLDYQQIEAAASSSPQEILWSRIDPAAIDSINGGELFSNKNYS